MLTALIIIASLCFVGIIVCILLIMKLYNLTVQVCINNNELYEAVHDVIELLEELTENK
jgi:type III secretion system FlhB-like substrate exporter